jgi:hypothetical protein
MTLHEVQLLETQISQLDEEIGHGTAPAIQPPHGNHIDIAAAGRIEQLLTEFPHRGSRADFFDFDRNDPSAPAGKLAPHAALQR